MVSEIGTYPMILLYTLVGAVALISRPAGCGASVSVYPALPLAPTALAL